MCLTVNSWSPSLWSHNWGWSVFSIPGEFVNHVWPIRRRLIITSIYLINLGTMACNLFPSSLSQHLCHKEINGWIFVKKSVHGILKRTGYAFDKASLTARSASSLPFISLWLGIQQNVICLSWFNISLHVCKTLFTRRFLLAWSPMVCSIQKSERLDFWFPNQLIHTLRLY